MEKHPRVIPSQNVSDSIFVKANGKILNKQKQLLQISLCELHNDLVLPVCQGGFHGARNEYGRVFIGDNYPRNYIPRYAKPMGKTNKITCGCETCISSMLLQYNFNKWRLTQMEKFI